MLCNKRYTSEFTDFMQEFLRKNPDIALSQQQGRALLWDKPPVTPEALINSAHWIGKSKERSKLN